jgi:FeS assembly protein IscX
MTIEVSMMDFPLYWDDSYEIALELKKRYPHNALDDISIEMIHQWTITLPQFQDDLDLVNDEILQAIFREWFEEVISNE